MSELLLQIGATKLAVSIVLAGAAWIVQRRVGRPAVSHPLWLLVLLTLLVPAVVSLPVLPAEPDRPVVAPGTSTAHAVLAEGISDSSPLLRLSAVAGPGLAIAWLLGTIGLLGWSLARTARFRDRLAEASRRASAPRRSAFRETPWFQLRGVATPTRRGHERYPRSARDVPGRYPPLVHRSRPRGSGPNR